MFGIRRKGHIRFILLNDCRDPAGIDRRAFKEGKNDLLRSLYNVCDKCLVSLHTEHGNKQKVLHRPGWFSETVDQLI